MKVCVLGGQGRSRKDPRDCTRYRDKRTRADIDFQDSPPGDQLPIACLRKRSPYPLLDETFIASVSSRNQFTATWSPHFMEVECLSEMGEVVW